MEDLKAWVDRESDIHSNPAAAILFTDGMQGLGSCEFMNAKAEQSFDFGVTCLIICGPAISAISVFCFVLRCCSPFCEPDCSIAMATPSNASGRQVPICVFCFGFPRSGTSCMRSLIHRLRPRLARFVPVLPFAFASCDLFSTQKKALAVLAFMTFHSSFVTMTNPALLTPPSSSAKRPSPTWLHRLQSLLRLASVLSPPQIKLSALWKWAHEANFLSESTSTRADWNGLSS